MSRFYKDWPSQAGQDKWVVDFFKSKRNGYFLDVGAFNGDEDSNTYYLEKELGWDGLCLEAGIPEFNACKSKRSVPTILLGIWKEKTIMYFDNTSHSINKYEHRFSETFNKGVNWVGQQNMGVPVACNTLAYVIEKYNVPNIIDYVSLDIEGCELAALEGWPWETHEAILWTVEHNLYRENDSGMKNDIFNFLTKKGYERVMDNVSCKDSNNLPFEDWYVNKKYLPENYSYTR